jgi:hypothetical protein
MVGRDARGPHAGRAGTDHKEVVVKGHVTRLDIQNADSTLLTAVARRNESR